MFASRRKARRIGGDEDGHPTSRRTGAVDGDPKENLSPNASSSHLSNNRPTNRSSSSSAAAGRISLSNSAEDDEDEKPLPAVIKPKKPSLARSAISNSAFRKKVPQIARPERDEDTPSYSSSYLQELKSSTPSTPKNLHQLEDPDLASDTTSVNLDAEAQDPQPNQDLDLASKLGTDLALHHTSSSTLIPTSTEIAEKKSRRSRLAKELRHQPQQQQEYISLNPSDTDDENRLPKSRSNSSSSSNSSSGKELTNYRSSTRRKRADYDRKATERLVREDIGNDDDDINAEGYQGSILFTKKSRREALAREKASIAARIHAAEKRHSSDSDFSDSSSSSNNNNHDEKDDSSSSEDEEAARTAAYEASQLHHGTSLLPSSTTSTSVLPSQKTDEYLAYESSRPRTPPKITPLPTLTSCLSKISSKLEVARRRKEDAVRKLEGIQKEIGDVRGREEDVRRGLRECGGRYEGVVGKGVMKGGKERGLENLGGGMRGDDHGGGVGEGGGEGKQEGEEEKENERGMGSLRLGYVEHKGLEREP